MARSAFRSQNVQSTSASDRFWKLRCRKSARRCGAKRMSKSKCTKHLSVGPLLEVEMSKKCTPLGARSACRSQHVKNTTGLDHFWTLRCRSAWQVQGIVDLVKNEQNVRVLSHFQLQPPLHHTTLQYTTLQLQLHLHYITLHYTPLHYTTFNYIRHFATLHYTVLHYTTPHSTTLHYNTLHSTTLHYTTLHYITLLSTTLHYITLQLH